MKISAEKAEKLRRELFAKIRVEVQAMREDSPASRSCFLVKNHPKRADFAQLLRKKLINRRLWHRKIEPILADERLVQLLNSEMYRLERRDRGFDAEEAQGTFDFAVFAHVPRRMHVEWDSVREFRVRLARYRTRANRNALALGDLERMGDLVIGQPDDLGMPEALARASGKAEEAAAKK